MAVWDESIEEREVVVDEEPAPLDPRTAAMVRHLHCILKPWRCPVSRAAIKACEAKGLAVWDEAQDTWNITPAGRAFLAEYEGRAA